MKSECPFCQIVSGAAPARIVYQAEGITAFHDRRPVAPLHILVVPDRHIASLNHVNAEDSSLLGRLISTASEIARQQGLAERGYRLVINTGSDGGQSVDHLHVHLIGGRPLPFRFDGR